MRIIGRGLNFGMEIEPFHAIILISMNENPLTHTPIKQDGTAGRRKSLLITGAVVLALIAIAAVAYSVYAWQQNRQLSTDITTKNTQIADLQKQKTTSSPVTTPTTQPADPYAGWRIATLKYEKATFKYPSTWTVSTGSAPGGSGVNPGTDYAKLVSPTGLTLRINTGIGATDSGPSCGTLSATVSVSALDGSYYLGFRTSSSGSSSSASLTTGVLCTTADSTASWPTSKNLSSANGNVYDALSMAYYDASDNVIPKSVSTYQSDSSYNEALLIIKSLSY